MNNEKCIGSILGAAVGDSMGWPNEQNCKRINKVNFNDKNIFHNWVRKNGGRYWSHIEEIGPGEYSDDTQLIIATARSLRYGKSWLRHFTEIELPIWLLYERGGGRATKYAASEWSKGNAPWNNKDLKKVKKYYNSGGNGVAMRILPHIIYEDLKYKEIMYRVFFNGMSTHGHPRALLGALLYADALYYLYNKKSNLRFGELIEILIDRKNYWGRFPVDNKDVNEWIELYNKLFENNYISEWNIVVEEILHLLSIAKKGITEGVLDIGNDVLTELGCFNKSINGSGTITAVASIYLFSKYASRPLEGLIETAYLKKSDSDTLASMVGALFGMVYGVDFIPELLLKVQDSKFLKKVIDSNKRNIVSNKVDNKIITIEKLKKKFKNLKIGESIEVVPFGRIILKKEVINKTSLTNKSIITQMFISEEGQSLFIKLYKLENINEDVSFKNKKINDFVVDNLLKISELLLLSYNILPNEMSLKSVFDFLNDYFIELSKSEGLYFKTINENRLLLKWSKEGINKKILLDLFNILYDKSLR